MRKFNKRYIISAITVLLIIFSANSVLANDNNQNENQSRQASSDLLSNESNNLKNARLKLESAFNNYREGKIKAAKSDLKQATEYLNKATQTSKTEKAKKEAHMLAVEINTFQEEIGKVSEQHENVIARFIHRTTSIIKREIDHLIHSYVELSTAEKTLKYLLDAKMYLFNAEHDLFVSHDAEDAAEEFDKVLGYLLKAAKVATPVVNKKIDGLSKDIQKLKTSISSDKEAWRNNEVVNSLDKALENLTNASTNAPPAIRLRIESVEFDIRELRTDVQRINIRNNYISVRATLQNIINEL